MSTPDNKEGSEIMNTTVGELTAAYYEEALKEFGDPRIAERIAWQMLRSTLARLDKLKETDQQAA